MDKEKHLIGSKFT